VFAKNSKFCYFFSMRLIKAHNSCFPFRLIDSGPRDAFYNMALDQALLEAVAGGSSPPVLRFYGWSPPAVSLGYAQELAEEVDLTALERHGVDVVRRVSGGGAVFHHEELTYSLIMREGHPLAAGSVPETYRRLCAALIAGLALIGVEAAFQPVNDIVVHGIAGHSGKKISGNAQSRRLGCLLQHGTVLLGLDLELMFSLLTVKAEKLKKKRLEDARERVTSLRSLGIALDFAASVPIFTEGFRRALSLDYLAPPGRAAAPLTEAEDLRARELARTKFASKAWLHERKVI
jgi:lipoate-protein ligase A